MSTSPTGVPFQIAPPRRRPRRRKPPPLADGLLGTWKKPPKLDKTKFKVGKVGGGPRKGLYVAKRLKPAAAPPAAADPYAGNPDADLLRQYEGQPWAQNIIRRLRGDQQHHESYVADKVMPWQSAALTGLANIGKAAQDQFTGQTTAVAAGLASAAGAQPGLYAGTSGGAVASPNAFQQSASAQAMAQNASTMGQIAQWQGLMGTLQQTTYSQGQIAALSDYAKGLPALYAERRAKAIDEIDKYIAEQELEQQKFELQRMELAEEMRQARVSEADRATRTTIYGADVASRNSLDVAEFNTENQPRTQPTGPAPEGMQWVPNDEGGGQYEPIPGYGNEGGSGGTTPAAPSPARGQYPPNKLAKEGFIGGWKKKPSAAVVAKLRKSGRAKGGLVRATNGTWWIAGAGGTGGNNGSTGSTAKGSKSLISDLRSLYSGSTTSEGWRDIDTPAAMKAISYWVREEKSSFAGANRKVNLPKLNQVLRSAITDNNPLIAAVLKDLRGGFMTVRNGDLYWR